jgi:hypothetical protein
MRASAAGFDELTKALALGVSRRSFLSRVTRGLLALAGISLPAAFAEPRLTQKTFYVPPRIAKVKRANGTEFQVCIAAYLFQEGNKFGIGAIKLGLNDSCPTDPEKYIQKNGEDLVARGDCGNPADLVGDAEEEEVFDGANWQILPGPAGIFHLVGKDKAGQSQWYTFCANVLKPGSGNASRTVYPRLLICEDLPRGRHEKIQCPSIQKCNLTRLETKEPISGP